jgi:hypothetical protein
MPKMVLSIIMQAHGHTPQEQTLNLHGGQPDEAARFFMQVEL